MAALVPPSMTIDVAGFNPKRGALFEDFIATPAIRVGYADGVKKEEGTETGTRARYPF